MNPWLAALVAAAGVWLYHSRLQQQAQNAGAQAGTQAGAGETSDQGGAGFTPENPLVPYTGGVTQPISSVSYSPPDSGGGGSSTGGTSFYTPGGPNVPYTGGNNPTSSGSIDLGTSPYVTYITDGGFTTRANPSTVFHSGGNQPV